MNIADYLYYKLPKVYQAEDKEQLLRRFIDTFAEAGFNPLLQETLSITDLLDVDKCPSKFLPQLCRMYGYEYTLELPELFQRRLLKHIVEMYKRKGTKSVVRFIARELTGFDSDIIENKDFTEEHVALTKWDIKFEHYRNFILKLTAPYEDSNLFNKEDIVIKIVNDFLPTNSQVFLITAYWFKEEAEIVRKAIDEISELVKDYNSDISTIRKKSVYSDNVFSRLHVEVESHTFMGEEDSYLNVPYTTGLPLYTNALVKIRDTIKHGLISYDHFIKPVEGKSNETFALNEGELSNNIKSYSYKADTRFKTKMRAEVDNSSLVVNSVFSIHNKVKPNVEVESFTQNKNNEVDRKYKVSINPYMEILQDGRINYNSCDIINTKEGETFNYHLKELSQKTTLLNLSLVLTTNAIHSYDIIKQKGKPDKIILI